MRELRVGVAGAGLIASEHVHAYAATPGVRVVAVADPVADKAEGLASTVGASVVADLDAMLEAGVDIVSVCTPPLSHASLTVAALGAGCSVLCEKPIARTLGDARRIVDASRAAAGIAMIGHVSRFEPDHRQAKDVVDAGHLGSVQMASHSMTTSLPGWSEGDWLADAEQSGGPLVDLAVHSFDYLSWATGSQPVRVHALGADTAAGPSTYVLTNLRYACGAIGLVETSWGHPAAHGFKLRAELIGTEGRLNWDYDHLNGGTMYRAGGETSWFDPLGRRGYRAEIGCFTEAVRSGGPSPVAADDGFAALRTALAAQESVRSGRTVDLTSWECW